MLLACGSEGDLHGSEAAVLPSNPRLGAGVVIVVNVEGELVLGIVLPGQVAQNSITLEDGEVAVVVVNQDRDAAVGVEGSEPRLLLDVLADVDGLHGVVLAVGVPQLLEEDGGFDAVGGAPSEELYALGGDEASGTRHGRVVATEDQGFNSEVSEWKP